LPAGRKPGQFRETRGITLSKVMLETLDELAKQRGKSISKLVEEAILYWRLHDKQGAIAGDREVFAYELGGIQEKKVRLGMRITQGELDTIRQVFKELGGKLDDEQCFNEIVPKLYSYDFANNPHKIGPAQVALFELGSRLKIREAEIAKHLSMVRSKRS